MAYYYQLKESFIQTPVLIHNIWAENQHRIISSLKEFFQHKKRGTERQAHAYIAIIYTSLYSPNPHNSCGNKIFILQGKITALSPRLHSIEQAKNYLHVITSIDSVL